MKALLPLTVAVALLVAPHNGNAQDFTGNWLLESCADDRAFFSSGLCSGYIAGIRDGAMGQAFNARLQAKDMLFCMPPGVTNGQLQKIVVAYLRTNPAQTHLPASYLTILAISAAFPCASQSR